MRISTRESNDISLEEIVQDERPVLSELLINGRLAQWIIEMPVVAKADVLSDVSCLSLKLQVTIIGSWRENLFPEFLCHKTIELFNAVQVGVLEVMVFLDEFIFTLVTWHGYLMMDFLDQSEEHACEVLEPLLELVVSKD